MPPSPSPRSRVKNLLLSLALGATVGLLFAGCNPDAFDAESAAPPPGVSAPHADPVP